MLYMHLVPPFFSFFQARLYEEFGQSSAGRTVAQSITDDSSDSNTGVKGHVFQVSLTHITSKSSRGDHWHVI